MTFEEGWTDPSEAAKWDRYLLVHLNDRLGERMLVVRHLTTSPTPVTVKAAGTRDACLAAKRLLEMP